jgi:hypothetical protein
LVSFTTVSPVGDWGVADRPRPADRAGLLPDIARDRTPF